MKTKRMVMVALSGLWALVVLTLMSHARADVPTIEDYLVRGIRGNGWVLGTALVVAALAGIVLLVIRGRARKARK